MCGFCTELPIFSIIQDFPLLEEDSSAALQMFKLSPFVEIDDWQSVISTVEDIPASVFLTRIYTEFLSRGYNQKLVDYFSNNSEAEINELFENQFAPTIPCDSFLSLRAISNPGVWDHVMYSQVDRQWCEDMLSKYTSLITESNQSIDLESNDISEYVKLSQENFFRLIVSLFFMIKVEPLSPDIKKIALGGFPSQPSFDGVELLLERTAFLLCYRQDGISFILDNYERIRLPLIWYVIIKENLSLDQLQQIKKCVENTVNPYCETLSKEELLEIIDDKMKCGKA